MDDGNYENKPIEDVNDSAVNMSDSALDSSSPDVISENKVEVNDNSKINQIKKYFMYIMVAGFVVSASISIFAVLLGEFNEVIAKALFTTLTIVVHSLLTVAFISIKHKKGPDEIVINTLFGVTATSLLSTILGIWKVIEGQVVVVDIYGACFYAVLAVFIIRFLLFANRVNNLTRVLTDITIGITVFAFVLLMPSVFINYPDTLPEFYYRLLWATIILHVTLSVLVAIFNRLYLNQHPEMMIEKSGSSKTPMAVKIILFIICLPVIIFILNWLPRLIFGPYGF